MTDQVLTTNTQSNAIGIVNRAVGKVVADAGVAIAETFTLGFTPRHIRVINLTDRVSYEWFAGMTSPGALKTAAAGTQTLETTEGITVDATANTFSVPAAIMIASKTFAWIAED